jgi:uncharacterized membrane protein
MTNPTNGGETQVKCFRATLPVSGVMLAFIAVATAADAPKLTFNFSRVNIPGATQTFVTGINNAGVMVGTYQDSAGTYHGFILDRKKITTLDVPHGTNTSIGNIRPNGAIEIVGGDTNSAGRATGFLYKDGHFTDIPGPRGSTASGANGINDDGDIVGSYLASNGVTEGYLLTKHGYTSFNVYMSQINVASGVNDRGKLVYWSVDGLSGNTTSYLYDIKTQQSTTINVPGASDSLAEDISNVGNVTYQWIDSEGVSHGALLRGGTYYKFDYSNSVWDYAAGLNDRNRIVGSYEAVSNGPFQGFKAIY